MYLPAHFREGDLSTLHDAIERTGLAREGDPVVAALVRAGRGGT